MMDDSLTIKIEILQRPYSVRVKKKDEAIFRQAGLSIEQLVRKYTSKGAVYRDKQDLLAMALLESTVATLINKKEQSDFAADKRVFEKLSAINDYLSFDLDEIK